MAERDAAPACELRKLALGRCRGTRKQVYAVCATQTAMPGPLRVPARSWLRRGPFLIGAAEKRGPALTKRCQTVRREAAVRCG